MQRGNFSFYLTLIAGCSREEEGSEESEEEKQQKQEQQQKILGQESQHAPRWQ